MKKTLNVGLIGFGMIGKVHAFAYSTLPYYAPGLELNGKIVAVATSREETAKRAQETIGCARATTNWREIIDDPEIDVVHICTPNAEHLPALLAAIRAGKHIYCEKPVVASAEETAILRAALAESNYRGITQTAFHLRALTAMRRAKELIDSGKLGTIVQYRIGYYHTSMLSPETPIRWKHGEKGGTILDLASHVLDLVDYLVGLPAELSAQTTTLWQTRPLRARKEGERLESIESAPVLAEDSVSILTRGLDPDSAKRRVKLATTERPYESPSLFPLGATDAPLGIADPNDRAALTGVVEATKLANGNEDEMRLELSGTRGALRFSLMDSHYLDYFDGTKASKPYGGESGWTRIACGGRYEEPESEFPSPKSTTGWVRAHVSSLATFYRSIAEGRALGADLYQAARVQDALETVRRSSLARTWERLA